MPDVVIVMHVSCWLWCVTCILPSESKEAERDMSSEQHDDNARAMCVTRPAVHVRTVMHGREYPHVHSIGGGDGGGDGGGEEEGGWRRRSDK